MVVELVVAASDVSVTYFSKDWNIGGVQLNDVMGSMGRVVQVENAMSTLETNLRASSSNFFPRRFPTKRQPITSRCLRLWAVRYRAITVYT